MLVFHRSTSALPVHGGPLRGAHSTPARPSKTTCLRSQDDPCGSASTSAYQSGIMAQVAASGAFRNFQMDGVAIWGCWRWLL